MLKQSYTIIVAFLPKIRQLMSASILLPNLDQKQV